MFFWGHDLKMDSLQIKTPVNTLYEMHTVLIFDPLSGHMLCNIEARHSEKSLRHLIEVETCLFLLYSQRISRLISSIFLILF